MTLRELATNGSKLWFQWACFKLGMFVGCIIGMLFMAVLMTIPKGLAALTGVVQ